jgi:uncharacterized RDD family membrane protein YckC
MAATGNRDRGHGRSHSATDPTSLVPDLPAGFWRRYAAWTLDAVPIAALALLFAASGSGDRITALRVAFDALSATMATLMIDGLESMQSPLLLVQQWLRDPALHEGAATLQSALGALLLPPLLGFVAIALVYGVAFERSPWQATPGKRALGLAVVDERGRRITAGHALLRFCAGALSWLTLNLGHAMAALPPQHLTLHDRISGTRVVRTSAGATMPAWAKAWLVLQLCAFVAANAWAFAALSRAMQAAVERALL